MSNIILTEEASKEVKRILAEADEKDQVYLRLKIVGAGCSGYSTKLDFDSVYNEKTDQIFEQNGVKIVVDNRSILYADGATIDYHNDLNKVGIKVDIVGISSKSGCGQSLGYA